MNLLLWISIIFIVIGIITNVATKNIKDSKKSANIQSMIWGVLGVILFVWWSFT